MSVLVQCILNDMMRVRVCDPIVPKLIAILHALEHAADIQSGTVDSQEALEDTDKDISGT